MKKALLLIALIGLLGCSTWNKMTKTQKIEASVTYYRTFSAGLRMAADIAAATNPDLASAADTAKTAVNILDSMVDAYAQQQIQSEAVYGAAKAANAAVATVAVQENGLQSFFDGSMIRTAYPARTCNRTDLYGINCFGLGISFG